MKTYVIAPDQRTSRYYAQAFGMDLNPRRTILISGDPRSSGYRTLMGIGAGEFYVVNSDNGDISREILLRLRVLEQMHPESVTVEWIGFGEELPPRREPSTSPRAPQWWERLLPRPIRG